MSLILDALQSYDRTNRKEPRNIVVCTHAKFSSVELCRALQQAGITVTFYPVEYSRDAKNIDKLLRLGIEVIEHPKKLVPFIEKADCVIEDGARISRLIQKYKIPTRKNFFSVEQTSGGIRYFEENPAPYPVIDVAMSPIKLDIENRRATPESVIRYFSEDTGLLLGGKRVLIMGFGSIGEGIARLAQTLGARVTIYDIFATKRLFARNHGYEVVDTEMFDQILPYQDVIFMATNTYQGTAIGPEQLLLMCDGTVICNAGSGRGELALSLQKPGTYNLHDATMKIRESDRHLYITFGKYNVEKTITVLGKSFPVNLHLGKGTSHGAIEFVMTMLLLAALSGPTKKGNGIQPLSLEIQEHVAQTALLIDRPSRTFSPVHIKTHSLDSIEKPYGEIRPFHNHLSEVANTSVARVRYRGGDKTRGHYHNRSEEAFYVESGTAKVDIWPVSNPGDRVTYNLEAGDYLLVPKKYFHDVSATSKEDFVCLVISSSPFSHWDQFFARKEIA